MTMTSSGISFPRKFIQLTSELRTPRLLLRRFTPEDAPVLMELNSDPEVVRYLAEGPLTVEKSLEIVESLKLQYKNFGIGRYVAIEVSTGDKIGWSGLKWMEDEKIVDVGFRLKQSAWGKGYATESAAAFLKEGFTTLDFTEITGKADVNNARSIHVLEKLGLRQTYVRELPGFPDKAVDMVVTREEFFSRFPRDA